ncbi:hypothetical protein Hanom_Chr06g00569851 [Helianthus anomalus]
MGGRIPFAERHAMGGGGDYCYAFWCASTSTSWRCTTTTVPAYFIFVLLFYI